MICSSIAGEPKVSALIGKELHLLTRRKKYCDSSLDLYTMKNAKIVPWSSLSVNLPYSLRLVLQYTWIEPKLLPGYWSENNLVTSDQGCLLSLLSFSRSSTSPVNHGMPFLEVLWALLQPGWVCLTSCRWVNSLVDHIFLSWHVVSSGMQCGSAPSNS